MEYALDTLPTLMSVSEFRDYLGIENHKAYAIVKERSFPSFKIGRKYYVNKGELPERIEKQSMRVK